MRLADKPKFSTMNIFVYANCQGQAFSTFWQKSLPDVQIRHVENWLALSGEKPVETFMNDVRNADVFIYQPISAQHGFLSTDPEVDGILGATRSGCRHLSFPYLYNDALWPCFLDGPLVSNGAVIDPMLEQGATLDDVLRAYDRGAIDFRYQARLANTLEMLAARELETDVRVAKFIEDGFQSHEYFFTQNHPSTAVFLHVLSQLHERVWERPAQFDDASFDRNIVGLPGRYPVSASAIENLALEYPAGPDDGSDLFYKDLLAKHVDNWLAAASVHQAS